MKSVLALLMLCACADFAFGCSCASVHPQQVFCNVDVVIRAKVIGKKEVFIDNSLKMIQYDIKQIKMFKGPDQEINSIFTTPFSSLCGVKFGINDKAEYLITGNLDPNGTLHVNVCNYITSWESLSMTQKKSLGTRYQMGCECKIVECSFIPCSITDPSECLWTDWVMEGSVYGTQARFYTCIKKHDNTCSWYRGSAPHKPKMLDIEETHD